MSRLDELWKEAHETPGKAIDIGRNVICDFCNDDYTDSPASGGVVFGSYAICQRCAHKVAEEKRGIKARCPEGQSFADFVRAYRGTNNSICVRAIPEPTCRICEQPFSDANVHTKAGWAETRITRTCEDCFNAIFDEAPE